MKRLERENEDALEVELAEEKEVLEHVLEHHEHEDLKRRNGEQHCALEEVSSEVDEQVHLRTEVRYSEEVQLPLAIRM